MGRTDKKYLPRSRSGFGTNFVETKNLYAALGTFYLLFSSILNRTKTSVNVKTIEINIKFHLPFKSFFQINYMTFSAWNQELKNSKTNLDIEKILYSNKVKAFHPLLGSMLNKTKTTVEVKTKEVNKNCHLPIISVFQIKYVTLSMWNQEIINSNVYLDIEIMFYSNKVIMWKCRFVPILQFSNFYKSKCLHATDQEKNLMRNLEYSIKSNEYHNFYYRIPHMHMLDKLCTVLHIYY